MGSSLNKINRNIYIISKFYYINITDNIFRNIVKMLS